MERFLALLERGDYRKNREISYYADKLFVTSKYLSEVCKKVSGFPANYWINRGSINGGTNRIYTLDGRLAGTLQKGVNIINGKKDYHEVILIDLFCAVKRQYVKVL